MKDKFGVEYGHNGKVLERCPEGFSGEYIIPEGVLEIKSLAFNECSNLTSILIPNSVTKIGSCAFKFCESLTSIIIPNSVSEIGSGAFWGCHSLADVILSDNLSVLESDVFRETSIEIIVIPDSVKKIENCAFEDCYYLQNVQLPNGIEIENAAFEGCNGMIQADAWYLNLYDNPHYKLVKVYAHAKNFVIPDDVVEIGNDVFAEDCKISSLVVPDSVRKVHSGAFRNNENLVSVTLGAGVTELGDESFAGCSSLKDIVIFSSIKKIPKRCFSGCDSLRSIVIPKSVEVLDDSSFEGCTNLVSIAFPNDLNNVGSKAFKDCINLKNVTYNIKLHLIGNESFYNCASLQYNVLPESLEEIGVSCFEKCISIKYCSFGDNVTSIPYRAFAGCKSLKEICLPKVLNAIEDKAFLGCSELSMINVNKSVKIGQDAFRGTSICDKHLLPPFKYYGKFLPSQWKSDTPSGKTKIKVYRGFFVDDIETANRVVEDIKQKGLYLDQITDLFKQKYGYKESCGHEKLHPTVLDEMYAAKDVLSHSYEKNNREYVYFGDYVCAMHYALRGNGETIPIVIEAGMEIDELNVDGVDSLNHVFHPDSNNALVRQVFGEKIDMYYEKYRAETIDVDDKTARKVQSIICDMAKSDNDIVYSFYKNSKCIYGKWGTMFRSAFQSKLPIESSRITSVRIVSRDYEFPKSGILLCDLR